MSNLLIANIKTLKVQSETFPLEDNTAFETIPEPEPVPIRLGVGQYACPFCHKIMRDSYKIRNHIMTHTGKRPFECSNCGRYFARKDILNRHLKTVHSQKYLLP